MCAYTTTTCRFSKYLQFLPFPVRGALATPMRRGRAPFSENLQVPYFFTFALTDRQKATKADEAFPECSHEQTSGADDQRLTQAGTHCVRRRQFANAPALGTDSLRFASRRGCAPTRSNLTTDHKSTWILYHCCTIAWVMYGTALPCPIGCIGHKRCRARCRRSGILGEAWEHQGGDRLRRPSRPAGFAHGPPLASVCVSDAKQVAGSSRLHLHY